MKPLARLFFLDPMRRMGMREPETFFAVISTKGRNLGAV